MKRLIIALSCLLLGAQSRATAVSAKNGPIKLDLMVRDQKIRKGEPIKASIRLSNIGPRKLLLDGSVFVDRSDFPRAMSAARYSREWVYLMLADAKGNDLPWELPLRGGGVAEETVTTSPGERARIDRLVAGWRAQGLDDEQIQRRLDKESARSQPPNTAPDPYRVLKPGESLEISNADLIGFTPSRPGKYFLRAVYDRAPSPARMKLLKTEGRRPSAEDVRIQTSAVEIEVLP